MTEQDPWGRRLGEQACFALKALPKLVMSGSLALSWGELIFYCGGQWVI